MDANLTDEAIALIDKFYEYQYFEGYLKNTRVGKIAMTRFLQLVIEGFEQKLQVARNQTETSNNSNTISEFYENMKFMLFSAHDTTVMSLLRALDLEQDEVYPPSVASSVFFELYKLGKCYPYPKF